MLFLSQPLNFSLSNARVYRVDLYLHKYEGPTGRISGLDRERTERSDVRPKKTKGDIYHLLTESEVITG